MNHQTKTRGFTRFEVTIVVAVTAVFVTLAVHGFLRARKQSQASTIIKDLRLTSVAAPQYAIETSAKARDPVNTDDWTDFLTKGTNISENSDIGAGSSVVLNLSPTPSDVLAKATGNPAATKRASSLSMRTRPARGGSSASANSVQKTSEIPLTTSASASMVSGSLTEAMMVSGVVTDHKRRPGSQ